MYRVKILRTGKTKDFEDKAKANEYARKVMGIQGYSVNIQEFKAKPVFSAINAFFKSV